MTKTTKAPAEADLNGLKLVGYCRVSTDNQKEDGTIEIQHTALAEYADAHGIDLVRVFSDEGISGAKDLENRPALSDLFDFIETHPDTDGVLIFKLDRLAREMRIQENLLYDIQETKGKRLVSIKEPDLASKDPDRVLHRQILTSFSQYEKSMIAMRTGLGRMRKARKGGYAGGGRAHGYTVNNHELEVDTTAAATVRRIFDMKAHGLSLNAIARTLNRERVPTARGGQWYARTVKYILENPVYTGRLSYGGETAERADLALVNA